MVLSLVLQKSRCANEGRHNSSLRAKRHILVLLQLVEKVLKSWEIDCHSSYLWNDSTVVLSWLNAQSVRLKVYVSNLVNQILKITNRKQ